MNDKMFTDKRFPLVEMVFAVLFASLLLCVPSAWAATGSVTAVTAYSSTAKSSTPVSSSYAIVKSDGYLHATNSQHTADYGYLWGSDNSSCSNALNGVTHLFIDSNVTSLKDVKVQYKSGKTNVNKTITLSGNTGRGGTHNVRVIRFLLNSANKNSCSTMENWYTFANLKSLEWVINFNATQMSAVPNGCFYKCSNLRAISIPSKANTIGASAFYDCDSLTSVDIPASVTSMGQTTTDGVFANCDNLAKVVLNSTSRVNIVSNSFTRTPSTLKIYVPNSVAARYQDSANSNPWIKAKLTAQIHPFLEVGDLPSATYAGQPIAPVPNVTWQGSAMSAANYNVSYFNNNEVGTASVTVTAKSPYTGTVTKNFAITAPVSNDKAATKAGSKTSAKASANKKAASTAKADQAMGAKGKKITVKRGKSASASKAMTVSGAQGKVTYAKVSGSPKIKVGANGKITVKKGCKKGTYKVKVDVRAAGNAKYMPASKTVTVTVKVK